VSRPTPQRPSADAEPLDAPGVDAPGVDAPAADDPTSDLVADDVRAGAANRDGVGGSPTGGSGRSIVRSSAIFAGLTLVSRLLGFVRDLVVTAFMGASAGVAADAWQTALAFPNLFRRIFAEGAFAAAFVPAYSRSLARDGEEVADVLAADAMATLAAATIVIALAAELTMPWLMYLINPGYAHDPAKFKLAVLLTQITMPYLPCMAIYAHLSGVLNARGRFVLSALAPALLNIGTLITILPQHTPRGAAIAAAVGAVGAGVAQAALLWWGVRRSGARVDVRLPRLTPEIKALIALAIPGALAASATQINIFFSGFMASLVDGARAWLAVADRLYQLPYGMIGVAIGVTLLPRLSSAVHQGDERGAQAAMDQAVAISMALTLPAAAALAAMPFFLIDGLFTRGLFHVYDAQATAKALFFYGLGTPAFILNRVLAPAFYARQDTRSPMRFALISVAVNLVCGGLFFVVLHAVDHGPGAGFQGIAAATALASWINVAQMARVLARRGFYRPSPVELARLVKIVAASVALGLFLALASARRAHYQDLFLRKEGALVAVVALGVALYFGLLFALQAVSPAELRGVLRRGPKAAGGAGPELAPEI